MVKFYDLYIKNFNQENEYLNTLYFAKKLGYAGIALESQIQNDVKDNHLEIYYRKNIFSDNIKDIKHHLRNVKNKNIILSVNTQNRALASWCARDERIKIISLDLSNIKKIHKNTIKVANRNSTYFELSIYDLLFQNKISFVKKISILAQKIKEIKKLGAEFIITSAAENIFQMRSPKDIIALFYMLNIDDSLAKKAISENPKNIIEKIY